MESFVFFQNLYDQLQLWLVQWADEGMLRILAWGYSVALPAVTFWIMWRGYRLVTGASHEGSAGVFYDLVRVAVVLSIANGTLFYNQELRKGIDDLANAWLPAVNGEDPHHLMMLLDQAALTLQKTLTQLNQTIPNAWNGMVQMSSMAWLSLIGQALPITVLAGVALLNQVAVSLMIVLAPVAILLLATSETQHYFIQWARWMAALLLQWVVVLVFGPWILKLVNMYAQPLLQLSQTWGTAQSAATQASLMNSTVMQAILGVVLTILEIGVFSLLLLVITRVGARLSSMVNAMVRPTSFTESHRTHHTAPHMAHTVAGQIQWSHQQHILRWHNQWLSSHSKVSTGERGHHRLQHSLGTESVKGARANNRFTHFSFDAPLDLSKIPEPRLPESNPHDKETH